MCFDIAVLNEYILQGILYLLSIDRVCQWYRSCQESLVKISLKMKFLTKIKFIMVERALNIQFVPPYIYNDQEFFPSFKFFASDFKRQTHNVILRKEFAAYR